MDDPIDIENMEGRKFIDTGRWKFFLDLVDWGGEVMMQFLSIMV